MTVLYEPINGFENDKARSDYQETRTKADEEAPEKIREALLCIRRQIFEVPFITFYRKEYVNPWLDDPSDLWRVYESDEKVRQMNLRALSVMWQIFSYDERVCFLGGGVCVE